MDVICVMQIVLAIQPDAFNSALLNTSNRLIGKHL